jgi:hypothetical protein
VGASLYSTRERERERRDRKPVAFAVFNEIVKKEDILAQVFPSTQDDKGEDLEIQTNSTELKS